ncbi:CYTH and CHAD domain-containing protein [Thalassotalea profundi]|uniref:Inorganic triphosphatase n=1 Tax=Thalassotalea profundi TaxID=2036687 RepID=A0ABQ3IJQ0_9GAMM|nr:CYTH and CHAD domain-containing protein [Thalassotalea profundi]GHE84249.1 inorganic triphosphatase [Thalassotalea profundi]
MNTEIELKYLVLSQDVEATITSLLNAKKLTFEKNEKLLSNCYFDTPDLALRKKDYGLRVRGCNGHIEQTIKTAGSVVGGLHQRPEYNIEIQNSFPDLSLFPTNIWSQEDNVTQLQEQLIALFDTDFTRITWLVEFQNSKVEFAFDCGTISSDGQELEISEIELELVSGSVEHLFALARVIFSGLLLRPGIKSKAARGYSLWHKKNQLDENTNLQIDSSGKDLKENFTQGISHCLQQLHLAIEHYIEQPSYEHLEPVIDVLVMLRHGFWLFDLRLNEKGHEIREQLSLFIQLFDWLDSAIYLRELMNKTGNYRKKLDLSEQLIEQLRIEKQRFPEQSHVIELIHSERFNTIQLTLLELICSKAEDVFTPLTTEVDYRQYAKEKLSASLNDLLSVLPEKNLTIEQYLALRKLVKRSLLTGGWFGLLFDAQLRDQFRMPWLDIQQGLGELRSLWIIHQQLERLEDAPKKLISWHQSKLDNLLLALEHSRQSATTQQPYWLE